LILAAPAPSDETIVEAVGSRDVAKAQEDNNLFLLPQLTLLSLLLG